MFFGNIPLLTFKQEQSKNKRCWLGKKVISLIGYLLTDDLNCLTVKYLASWHLE